MAKAVWWNKGQVFTVEEENGKNVTYVESEKDGFKKYKVLRLFGDERR